MVDVNFGVSSVIMESSPYGSLKVASFSSSASLSTSNVSGIGHSYIVLMDRVIYFLFYCFYCIVSFLTY